jgi:hypothetical protein
MGQVHGVSLGPAAGRIGMQDDQGDLQVRPVPSMAGMEMFRRGCDMFRLRSCRAMERTFRSIEQRRRPMLAGGKFRRWA